MNGTIVLDGSPPEGLSSALAGLRGPLRVVAVTADTRGEAAELGRALDIEVHVIDAGDEAERKRSFVRSLGAERVVAVGNGANDALMLEEAALGVCVIGREGASAGALRAADVVFTDVVDALFALSDTRRLIATLRR